jgi:hypothetical protein
MLASSCHRRAKRVAIATGIVAAHHGAEIARSGKLVMQAAIGDEEHLAVADLAVDDPRQIDARLANQIAAQFDAERGSASTAGSAANCSASFCAHPREMSTGSSPGK